MFVCDSLPSTLRSPFNVFSWEKMVEKEGKRYVQRATLEAKKMCKLFRIFGEIQSNEKRGSKQHVEALKHAARKGFLARGEKNALLTYFYNKIAFFRFHPHTTAQYALLCCRLHVNKVIFRRPISFLQQYS